MKKIKKNYGCTAKEMFAAMSALAGSEKLRKETEDYFKSKGMDITIDKCGIGHLYTPLYVSDPTGQFSKKLEKWDNINSTNNLYGNKNYPQECKCKNCIASKNKKRKCLDCGKMSMEYVHAIGWECTNKQCHKKRQDKLIAHFNSKSDTEKLLMANFVPLSHKDHMTLHKKNGKKIKGQEL